MANENINEPLAVPEMPEPAAVQDKPPIERHPADKYFVPVLFVLGYLFVNWIMFGGLGAGASAYTLIFTGCVICWFTVSGAKPGRETYPYIALMLLIAAYFLVYENWVLKPFALILQMALACYSVAAAGRTRVEPRLGGFLAIDMLDSAVITPFGSFISAPRVLSAEAKSSPNTRRVALLVAGIAVGLLPAMYIAWMLFNADAAFESLVDRLYRDMFNDWGETAIKLTLSIPVSLYLYGLVFGTKQRKSKPRLDEESAEKSLGKLRFLPTPLIIGVVTPLLLLYTAFFLSQSAYFLSAFGGLLPSGYSYAEYARRGFFELCAISCVNFFFIFLLMFLTGKSEGSGKAQKIFSVILSLFSIALVVMSLSKMLMYIGIYGLTPKRLYTSAFMTLLLIMFVYLIVKSVYGKFNLVKWAAVTAVAGFLAFSLSNPDYLIAKYNIEAYKSGRLDDLDVFMIADLSSAAIPCLIDAYESPEIPADMRSNLQNILDGKKYVYAEGFGYDWKSFTLTRMNSARLLADWKP